MYKLLGTATSRAFRPIWALEEMGLAYDYDPVSAGSPEARAKSPTGKIPVLIDGDQAIWDSTAIMTYLADKHGLLTYPAGSRERARQDSITHLVLDEFDSVLWTATKHRFILPEDRRVPDVAQSLKWEYGRNIAHLEQVFVGPFMAGDQFTIADIVTTHCLSWGFMAKFPNDSEKLLSYAKQMRARPAHLRTAALIKR